MSNLTDHEKRVEELATQLAAAIAALDINLGWGQPARAGKERNGTLRVELYVPADPDEITNLEKLIAALESAKVTR